MKDVPLYWEKWTEKNPIPYFPHVSVGWDNNPRFKKVETEISINDPDPTAHLSREEQLAVMYFRCIPDEKLDEAIETAVKKHRGVPKQKIANAVKTLMENDVISERAVANSKGKKQKMLFVDWEKAEKYLNSAD